MIYRLFDDARRGPRTLRWRRSRAARNGLEKRVCARDNEHERPVKFFPSQGLVGSNSVCADRIAHTRRVSVRLRYIHADRIRSFATRFSFAHAVRCVFARVRVARY